MRLVRLTLLVLALGFLTLIAAAIPGHAHALLERSDPPAYRLLLKPPDAIVLRFSEAADPAGTRIIVQDQDGVLISFMPLMEHFGTVTAEAAAEGNGRFTLKGHGLG